MSADATGTDFELRFKADLQNLRSGIVEIQSSIDGLAKNLQKVKLKPEGGSDGLGGLERQVKSLKSEMASGDRTINFFARSLNSIVPEASMAGQGIRLLADGLLGGVGLGFGLQVVQTGLEMFGEYLKKETEALEKSAEATAKKTEEVKKLNQEMESNRLVAGGMAPDVAKSQVEINAINREINAAQGNVAYFNRLAQQKLEQAAGAGFWERSGLLEESGKLKAKAADAQNILDELIVKRRQVSDRIARQDAASRIEQDRKADEAILAAKKDSLTEEEYILEEFRLKEKALELEYAHASAGKVEELRVALRTQALEKIRQLHEKYDLEIAADSLKRAEELEKRIREKLGPTDFFGKTEAEQDVSRTGFYGIQLPDTKKDTAYPVVPFAGQMDVGDPQAGARAAIGAEILTAEHDQLQKKTEELGKSLGRALNEPMVGAFQLAFDAMLGIEDDYAKRMRRVGMQFAMGIAGFAVSQIPGLGGFLGPMISGLRLPSAAGGWNVPSGIPGPIPAILHEDEMVLDKQTKRAVLNGTGTTVNLNISAVDPRSFTALAYENPEAIIGPLREAMRDRRF